jgi:hypothetical protein
MKDYLERKRKGELVILTRQLRLEKSLMPVALPFNEITGKPFSADGKRSLRFGDRVMLKSHCSNGYISANAEEKIVRVSEAKCGTCLFALGYWFICATCLCCHCQ